MSEYTKLLAKSAIRFTGSPVTLSPQLEDYGIQNILHPVASERNVKFRVVLYVPFLEQNEMRIVFPTDNTMEVHMEHGHRKMATRRQVSWSRDCRYFIKLPEGVHKNCLTAIWTHDSFLIIQSRGPRPLTMSDEKEYDVDQIIPSRVCAILRPHLDLSILKDMLWLHQTEVDEICNYLETRGTVSENQDVREMLKSFTGKLKQCKKQQESKGFDKQTETQNNQDLEEAAESQEGKGLKESMNSKENKTTGLIETKENKNLSEVKEPREKQSLEKTQERKNLDEPMESQENKSLKNQNLEDELETAKSEVKLEAVQGHPKDEEALMETDTTPD